MSVFRVERTTNYTVMSNYHLRDKRLSLKAKGLLSQMLSLPDDWDYTLSGLAHINIEGKDAVRAAVKELEKAGYIHRLRVRDDGGRLRGTEYIIYERPQPCSGKNFSASSNRGTAGEPVSENPTLENPALGKPVQENQTQLNKDRQNKELQSKDSILFPSGRGAKEAASEKQKPASRRDMNEYRALIRENVGYAGFVRERPWDAGQLDEMIELMVDAVCSNRKTIRVCGSDFPQAAVKSRLLKLDGEHIRFVFDCLRENTAQVRNMKQYLLAVLYNAPVTMENHYAARVNHDLGSAA